MNNLEKSYQKLIDELVDSGVLRSEEIIRAFRKIKRTDLVLADDEGMAFVDEALSIGRGQTISQPTTVAFMFELLQPKKGNKILDVGSGSGWTTTLLAEIIGASGKVFGLELLPEICHFGEKNIEKYGFIQNKIVENICGDGYLGLEKYAPFDRILVSAAAEEVPKNLLRQLKVSGRLVVPISQDEAGQAIVLVEKFDENRYEKTVFPGFIFVPMVHGEKT